MGKSSKKKLEAKLTEADAGLRDLESARAALTEELRSERERHAEETTTLRREHEQLVDELRRSTKEELARAGQQLTEARAALETATEETPSRGRPARPGRAFTHAATGPRRRRGSGARAAGRCADADP